MNFDMRYLIKVELYNKQNSAGRGLDTFGTAVMGVTKRVLVSHSRCCSKDKDREGIKITVIAREWNSGILPEDNVGVRVRVLGSGTRCGWEEPVFPNFWYGDHFGKLQRYHAVHQIFFRHDCELYLDLSLRHKLRSPESNIEPASKREHRDRAILSFCFFFSFFYFSFVRNRSWIRRG